MTNNEKSFRYPTHFFYTPCMVGESINLKILTATAALLQNFTKLT